jgi:hypothetical protein
LYILLYHNPLFCSNLSGGFINLTLSCNKGA